MITKRRRETTAMLVETLGDARLREVRHQGPTMDTDDAVAYTLTHLEQNLTRRGDT